MLDPFVLGERFSGGTGIEGRPKVKKSAKLNYHIREYGVLDYI